MVPPAFFRKVSKGRRAIVPSYGSQSLKKVSLGSPGSDLASPWAGAAARSTARPDQVLRTIDVVEVRRVLHDPIERHIDDPRRPAKKVRGSENPRVGAGRCEVRRGRLRVGGGTGSDGPCPRPLFSRCRRPRGSVGRDARTLGAPPSGSRGHPRARRAAPRRGAPGARSRSRPEDRSIPGPGRSRRREMGVGVARDSSRPRRSERVESAVGPNGRTASRTRPRIGRPSILSWSLSRPKRRDRPPARTTTPSSIAGAQRAYRLGSAHGPRGPRGVARRASQVRGTSMDQGRPVPGDRLPYPPIGRRGWGLLCWAGSEYPEHRADGRPVDGAGVGPRGRAPMLASSIVTPLGGRSGGPERIIRVCINSQTPPVRGLPGAPRRGQVRWELGRHYTPQIGGVVPMMRALLRSGMGHWMKPDPLWVALGSADLPKEVRTSEGYTVATVDLPANARAGYGRFKESLWRSFHGPATREHFDHDYRSFVEYSYRMADRLLESVEDYDVFYIQDYQQILVGGLVGSTAPTLLRWHIPVEFGGYSEVVRRFFLKSMEGFDADRRQYPGRARGAGPGRVPRPGVPGVPVHRSERAALRDRYRARSFSREDRARGRAVPPVRRSDGSRQAAGPAHRRIRSSSPEVPEPQARARRRRELLHADPLRPPFSIEGGDLGRDAAQARSRPQGRGRSDLHRGALLGGPAGRVQVPPSSSPILRPGRGSV